MSSPTNIDVVVIGAGASGLYAGAILQQNNLDVVVLEARDRVGGRLLSAETADGRVDLGATWFWANEQRIATVIGNGGLAGFPQQDIQRRGNPADLSPPDHSTGAPNRTPEPASKA